MYDCFCLSLTINMDLIKHLNINILRLIWVLRAGQAIAGDITILLVLLLLHLILLYPNSAPTQANPSP